MSHKIFRIFFGVVFVLAQFLTGVTPVLAAAPANDNFDNAEFINSLPFNTTVDITEATIEPNEVMNCTWGGTVWYSFTPAENMAVQVNIPANQASGTVGLYLASGPTISDLTFMGCVFGNSVNFQLAAGETYYLQAGAFGSQGAFQFNLEQITPPGNDSFATPEVIASLPFSATADNTNATAELNEPQNCSFPFRSLWYSFTPAESMEVQMDTSGAQTVGTISLFLATGPAITDLTALTCASNAPTNFQLEGGQTYYFRLDSYNAQPGNLQINLQQLTPPVNDSFAGPTIVTSLPFSVTVDNTTASAESGEPSACGGVFRSVWYSFTPAQNMTLQLDMANSQVGGIVAVYSSFGPTISDLSFVACEFSGITSNFQVEAGQTYYFRLDSYSWQPGTLQMSLSEIVPPANDNFADAEVINGFPFNATADNTNASIQPGEPQGCSFPFRSVWYTFTPTENMAIQINIDSPVNASANLFMDNGSGLSGLTSLTCAYLGAGNARNFQVDAGTKYYLRVDTSGQPGSIQVNLQQLTPPANDRFANAEVVTALPFTASVDNTSASPEFGEPQDCSFAFRSLWYSFTPAESMTVQVVSPNGGTVSIFRASGPAITDLTSPICAYGGNSSNFPVEAGQKYYLRLDSGGQAGVLQLNVQQIFPPSNDNFASAEPISTLPFNISVDNSTATAQLNEPTGCAFPTRTLWYSFTPSENTAVRAGIMGGPVGSALDVYVASGPAITDLTSIGCVTSGGLTNFRFEAGRTYYLRIDTFGAPGVLQLSLESIVPPANDDFVNADLIDSLPFSVTVDTTDATFEPGEPLGCGGAGRSVWYSFTPAENMTVRLNTAGGSFYGNVAAYRATGSAMSDLTYLTCAGGTASVFLQLEAGEAYYLQLGAYTQGGVVQLNLQKLNPPANDNFANAETITNQPFHATVDITDATSEPNEPVACYYMPNSVWYRFVPTETITLRADTLGSPISGNVNIYKSTGPGFSGLQFLNCSGPGSSPAFLAEAGQTYYLQVGSSSGQVGIINVNLLQPVPPLNDNFANATEISSVPFSATTNVLDATTETDEPQPCYSMNNTAWYSFIPGQTTRFRADTLGSLVAGIVNIYHSTGSGFAGLEFLGCAGFGDGVTFLAVAGESYYFQVGAIGQPGIIQFNLAEVPSITGRVTDEITGSPLPGNIEPYATAHLYRECGDGCLEFVNSQSADGQGQFSFDSYYYGIPIPAGSYRIRVTAYLYPEKEFGPFEFSGSNLNVGDLAMSPPAMIRGRAVDSDTGSPLAGASVTLRRCDPNGCFEYVNSQGTDGDGHFEFNSFYYGVPLSGGDYELEISATLHEVRRVQVTIGDGENRDLGDVLVVPTPLINSISGRLLDGVTGAPIDPVFVPQVTLYRCDANGCFYMNSMSVDGTGRFRFETDSAGNRLIIGTYYIFYYADQYFSNTTASFDVGENMNRTLGNLKITSFPVRFSNVVPCPDIPGSGGDCDFSVKVWNGKSQDLSGKAWSMAEAFLPEFLFNYSNFQVKDPQDLSIAKGQNKVLRFRFNIPANTTSSGSYTCTRIYVGEGNQALLNTIGTRSLFCVFRNGSGYSIASPQDIASRIVTTVAMQTGSETEPNNSCQTAQDIGAVSEQFIMNGELDSSQAPDIDFFRFSATPGILVAVDHRGQSTGSGSLGDPLLGAFDSNCNLIAYNDDSTSLNSHLELTVPEDGVIILAATAYPDFSFQGGGYGSYELTIAPIPTIGSISGIVVDAVSGTPLSGSAEPYAYVRLVRCAEFGCFEMNSQLAGSDGRFRFETDHDGVPLRIGEYKLFIEANQYKSAESQLFTVGDGEDYNAGNVALTSYPVRFSDVQVCSVPSNGGLCDFTVKVTNGLATRFSGKAWSIINGYGLGTFVDSTLFQTDPPLDISLAPGRSTILRFRFHVRGSVANGATICATAFVGQNPGAQFNLAGIRGLFCFVKGSNGFTLMSEQQMQSQLHQMQIREAVPANPPAIQK